MFTLRKTGRAEGGYVLLILLLAVTLLVIAAVAIAPVVAFEVKRDREEELIHRGVQYSRAVRKFVKKVGRYPTRIEELDNTNQLRFLRKHYKDPVTGKDFKLLHQGDVQFSFAGGVNGGVSLAGLAQAGQAGGLAGQAGQLAGLAGLAQAGQAGGLAGQAFAAAQAGQNPFGNSFSSGNNSSSGQSSFGASGTPSNSGTNSGTGTSGTGNPATGDDTSGGTTGTTGQAGTPGQPGSPNGASGFGAGAGFGNAGTNQQFGGGPIVGVASLSKEKSIREFNRKNHYNQWQFIYDPSTDRGGLLNTPAQPPLQNAGLNGQQNPNGIPGQNGVPGQNGLGNSGFGNNPGTGNSGFGNNGTFGSSNGTNNPGGSQPTSQ